MAFRQPDSMIRWMTDTDDEIFSKRVLTPDDGTSGSKPMVQIDWAKPSKAVKRSSNKKSKKCPKGTKRSSRSPRSCLKPCSQGKRRSRVTNHCRSPKKKSSKKKCSQGKRRSRVTKHCRSVKKASKKKKSSK